MIEAPLRKAMQPNGWHTVTPRIVVRESAGLIEFLSHVFGATGEHRVDVPSVMQIGDSKLMISEAGPRAPTTALLYVYVADVDLTFRRAVECGARCIEEPSDMPYGDRRCMVEDRWGNGWQIAAAQ